MKKTKTLHLLTACAASAALLMAGCNINETPDYGQTTSETVSSASLAVTADKVNLDPGDTTGFEAEFTLTLTDSSFAFGAEADADLSGYVSIKALDSDGSAVSTVKTDKIRAKEAFEAGATSVTVYTTITDSGESDIVGNLAVSVSGGALKGSGKVSNTEKEIEVATCEIAGVETTLTSGASIANNLISIKGGTSLAENSITLYLIPKGKTAGYKYNGSADTDITADFDMIDTETGDSLLGALGTNGSVKASPATYEETDAIKIVITGGTGDAASWLTQSGTFVFSFADSDLVDAEGTAFSGNGTRTFMTTNDVWAISGASVSLSGDVLGTTVTDYGTVDASVDLGTITATVDAGGAEYSVTSLTITDGTNTWTSNVESDNVSFKPVITKDLSSSADNLNATLSFVVNATIDGQSATLPATDEVTVSLNYKSYLETPTAAQVILATGGSTTEEVYTTVINLAAFDKALSAAPAEGDTVATGTVGETAVTAVALSGATTTSIPVKIAGTGLSGAVTLTMSGDDSIVVKQTDTLHLATLKFVQDYSSVTTDTVGTYVKSLNAAAGLSVVNGYVQLQTAAAESAANYIAKNSGQRNMYTLDSFNVPSSGVYVLAFDALLNSANNNDKESSLSVRANTTTNNGTPTAYLFCMTATNSTTWTLKGTSETTTVTLDTATFYHFVLTVDIDNETVGVTIATAADPDTLLVDTTVTSTDSSYVASNINACLGRYVGTMALDNIVVFAAE